MDPRLKIARRAALLLQDGELVNLGIGIPTQVAALIPPSLRIFLHSENGIIGTGPRPELGAEDPDLVNAGGEPTTVVPGASFFDSAMAFALVRGGRLDTAILGALQVSEKGDLASWKVPGRFSPGMGGSMELALGARRVIVTMLHETKAGEPKIVRECTIPLTAPRAADVIITELALFRVIEEGLLLAERSRSVSVADVLTRTPCRVLVPEHIGVMEETEGGSPWSVTASSSTDHGVRPASGRM